MAESTLLHCMQFLSSLALVSLADVYTAHKVAWKMDQK